MAAFTPAFELAIAELRIAIARLKRRSPEQNRKHFELIIVATDPQEIPPEAADFPVLIRQETWIAEPEAFVTQIAARLRDLALNTEELRSTEATRLLNAKEYRAAVIAAMTHLEATLRERAERRPTVKSGWRPTSIRSLVEDAIAQHLQSEVSFISDVARYVLSSGGKRIRPVLLILSARLCAGVAGFGTLWTWRVGNNP